MFVTLEIDSTLMTVVWNQQQPETRFPCVVAIDCAALLMNWLMF